MWALPGKKLLFMGGEFGSWKEWNHDRGLDWEVLEFPKPTAACATAWASLNRLYRREPALSVARLRPEGFEWLDCDDCAAAVS